MRQRGISLYLQKVGLESLRNERNRRKSNEPDGEVDREYDIDDYCQKMRGWTTYMYIFIAGIRVCRTRSSCSSSSAGIRDSRSGGNSRSLNSSARGMELDLRHIESS
jgi:hypothetical protein